MSTGGVDTGRRRFLTAATTVVGGVGAAATLVPFLVSFKPSARAEAAGAPVEVDISKMEPGQQLTVEWRGKPVWIVRRTEQMLSDLASVEEQLRDPRSEKDQQPDYARNDVRSIKPEYLVVVGICTHLGCSPKYRPDIGAADLGGDWKGGFFCPCHGSKFDLAGRVYQGVPAPFNLEIPPYHYVTDSRLVVGVGQGAA